MALQLLRLPQRHLSTPLQQPLLRKRLSQTYPTVVPCCIGT